MPGPNQKLLYIDRRNTKGIRYMNLDTEGTFNVLSRIKNAGTIKVYLYLCAQVPHSYEGRPNDNRFGNAPFEFSPAAVEKIIPGIDRKTVQRGFNELIELGVIEQRKNNIYQFHDVPMEYRPKTMEEYTLQEALKDDKQRKAEQLIEESRVKWSWED